MKTKTKYTIAWIAWLAAFVVIEGTALFNHVAGDTLSENTWSWFHVFDPHPSPLYIALRTVLGLFLAWLCLHLTFGWNPGHPLPLVGDPVNRWKAWLKADAVNRAWRTFLHSVVAAGLVGAADAVVQVAVNALATKASGGAVDMRQVLHAAELAGASALFTPLLAYLHRYKLDPSALPSATPPDPPTPTPQA